MAQVTPKFDYTPTKPEDLNPRIIGWKRPRVYIVGIDEDVKSMFLRYGYIVRCGHFVEVHNDVDFVCFTGGADLNPRLYGQSMDPNTYPDSQRDLEEVEVYHRYANIPKVGICRGLQLLNVMNGGTMIQHVRNHQGTAGHEIEDIWGKRMQTSSVHHQMCVPPVNNAKVLAWANNVAFTNSKDPEVIWYPDTNCFGVQGHPEWGPNEFTDYFMVLLKGFVLPMCEFKNRSAIADQSQSETVH